MTVSASTADTPSLAEMLGRHRSPTVAPSLEHAAAKPVPEARSPVG